MEKMGGGRKRRFLSIARSFAAMRHYEVLDGFGMCLAMFFQKLAPGGCLGICLFADFSNLDTPKGIQKMNRGFLRFLLRVFLPNRSIFDFWNKINRQNQ